MLGEQGWLSTLGPGVDGRQMVPGDDIQVGLVWQQRACQQGTSVGLWGSWKNYHGSGAGRGGQRRRGFWGAGLALEGHHGGLLEVVTEVLEARRAQGKQGSH